MELHQLVGVALLLVSLAAGLGLHLAGHLTQGWIIGLVITAVIGLILIGAGLCMDLLDGLF